MLSVVVEIIKIILAAIVGIFILYGIYKGGKLISQIELDRRKSNSVGGAVQRVTTVSKYQ